MQDSLHSTSVRNKNAEVGDSEGIVTIPQPNATPVMAPDESQMIPIGNIARFKGHQVSVFQSEGILVKLTKVGSITS
jgi:hypothetical protein